jgi:hypothetical protein
LYSERRIVGKILQSHQIDARKWIVDDELLNAAQQSEEHFPYLDTFFRQSDPLMRNTADEFEVDGRLDVLSAHFDPKLALNTALTSSRQVRLPILAKPWTKIRRWAEKVLGEAI